MKYNVILDNAPVVYSGVHLKTDFKQVLKFIRAMDDDELDQDEKALIVSQLFVETIDADVTSMDITAAIEHLIAGPNKSEGSDGKKLFCFNADHGRLYAAFYQTYGIDLRKENMHWWVFLELFKGIPKDTVLMDVVELRGKKIPKKGDREYIQQLRRMKNIYRLDSDEREAEKVQKSISDMMGIIGR